MKPSRLLIVVFFASLAACVSPPKVRDGAPAVKVDGRHIPDAVPRHEKRTAAGNKSPYTVFGKTYRVMKESSGFTQQGEASWYGTKFHGNHTSNGEVYDMFQMTAAHKTLPIPSYVKVVNLENQRSVVVRVNDRGPFHGGRIIDLSYVAAQKLGFHNAGIANVRVEVVEPGRSLASGETQAPAAAQEPEPAVIVAAAVPDLSVPTQSEAALKPAAPSDSVVGEEKAAYLQAGAFSNLQSAQQFSVRLSSLTRIPVFVSEGLSDMRTIYRVRIGPIADELTGAALRELFTLEKLPSPHLVYE